MTEQNKLRTGAERGGDQRVITALDTVAVPVGHKNSDAAEGENFVCFADPVVVAVAGNGAERYPRKDAGQILRIGLMIPEMNHRIRHFPFDGFI